MPEKILLRFAVPSSVLAVLLLAVGGCTPPLLNKNDDKVFTSGYDDYQAGRYKDADRKFSEVVADNPQSAALSEVYYFRGLTRLQESRRNEARADFQAGATHYGRELTQIYSMTCLANMEYEDGHDQQAVPLYRTVLEHPVPGLPTDKILYRLGVSLQRLGRWNEADETFARLLKDHSDSPLAAEARIRTQADSFTLQAGAFTDRAKAATLAARLRQDGYPVVLAVVAAGGKTFHVVNVGHYHTAAEAQAASTRLAGKGYHCIMRP